MLPTVIKDTAIGIQYYAKNDNKINNFHPPKKKCYIQTSQKIKKPKQLTQQHVFCISEEVSINIACIK